MHTVIKALTLNVFLSTVNCGCFKITRLQINFFSNRLDDSEPYLDNPELVTDLLLCPSHLNSDFFFEEVIAHGYYSHPDQQIDETDNQLDLKKDSLKFTAGS